MEKVKGSQGFVNHQTVHDLTNIQTKNYIYDENTNTNINTDFSLDVIITTYNEMKIVSMKLSSYFIMFIFNQ